MADQEEIFTIRVNADGTIAKRELSDIEAQGKRLEAEGVNIPIKTTGDATTATKSLGELRAELSAAKAAVDGSEASIQKYSQALIAVQTRLAQIKTAQDAATQSTRAAAQSQEQLAQATQKASSITPSNVPSGRLSPMGEMEYYKEQARLRAEAMGQRLQQPVPEVSVESDVAAIKRAAGANRELGSSLDITSKEAQAAADALQEYNRQVMSGIGGAGQFRTNVSINKEGLQRVTETRKTEGEAGPVVTTTEIDNEARAFSKGATEANQYAAAVSRLSESQFQASLKGKSLEERLALIQQRLQQTGQATVEYNRLMGQQATLQDRIANQPIAGSLEALRNRATEAKSGFILGDPKSTKELSEATKAYDAALKGANETMGKTGGIASQIGATFERQVVRIGIGVAVWQTLRTAQHEIQETIKAMEQYSVAVARFAAITDQSIGEATQQYNALREAAVQRGIMPSAAASGIVETSRFQKTPGGQQELFGAATKLTEALGLSDVKQAVNALGEAQLATGQSASKMADLVAAGYKRVGGDATTFMNVLPSIKSLSDAMGLSFEKTFAIVVQGAAASGRTVDVVYQAFNRFTDSVDRLKGENIVTFANSLHVLGVDVLDVNKNLKPMGDILSEIGNKWSTFAPDIREKIIDIIGGGAIKGQARDAMRGVFQAAAEGAREGLGDVEGTLNSMNNMIDKTFGKMVDRVKARIEELRQNADTFGAMMNDIGLSVNVFLGSMAGGEKGGRQGAMASEFGVVERQLGDPRAAARKIKADFIASLSGLSREVADKAIDEYNTAWSDLATSMILPGAVGMTKVDRDKFAQQFTIDEATKQSIISNTKDLGTKTGLSFLDGILAGMKQLPSLLKGEVKDAVAGTTATAPTNFITAWKPADNMKSNFRMLAQDMFEQAGETGGAPNLSQLSQFLPTNELDLTKYSQEEINQAKQLSLQISQMEIQAIREQALAMGLTTAEANKVAEAYKQQLDTAVQLVRTQQGMKYEMGQDYANIQKALGKMKEDQSDFQFQRLKNVDPSQFGQLQALTAQYDAFLTKIGSPEKQMNINLLLGDQNVFKTMHARMTALQMALEDLTKVEKAQLSGTWNLPAGATALVPISSLDLQRWNKSEGGGFDAAALAAMLGATNTSGDKVSTAVQMSASQIVAAIKASYTGLGMTAPGQLEMAKMAANMDIMGLIATALTTAGVKLSPTMQERSAIQPQETGIAKFWDMWNKQPLAGGLREQKEEPIVGVSPRRESSVDIKTALAAFFGSISMMPQRLGLTEDKPLTGGQQTALLTQNIGMLAGNISRLSNLGAGGRFWSGGGMGDMGDDITKGMGKSGQTAVTVNVAALPIKATFNANLSVMMNGQVVARTVFPILYQMIVKAFTSQGIKSLQGARR